MLIGRVRKYINKSSTERLVHAFITSKLDYCNSLLYGLPSTVVQKLQRIQNTAARLVVKAKRTDHTSPILQQLHRLPVSERISFMILLLTNKTVNGYAPSYFEDLVNESLCTVTQFTFDFARLAHSSQIDHFNIRWSGLFDRRAETLAHAASNDKECAVSLCL